MRDLRPTASIARFIGRRLLFYGKILLRLRQLSTSIHQCRMAFRYKMVLEMRRVLSALFSSFPLLSPPSTRASTENQNSEPKICLGNPTRHCRRDHPTAAGTKALTTPGTPTWARRAATAPPPPTSALMQQGAKMAWRARMG